MTIAAPDPVSSVMKALSDVRITVYRRDTQNQVTIYRRHDGTTQGPTTESGAVGGPNPFVTGPSGLAEFWCDGPVEVDVAIEDTQAPSRLTARTIGWNCLTAAAGSIPGNMLADDASISLAKMGADVMRQVHQIGQVIDWWRPDLSVPVPTGWEICDGRQIPAGQHDFPGLANAAINLPDLRNRFIIGADATKALAQGANQGDLATDAPGIAGTGGSNRSKDFRHGHGVPGVDHVHYVPGVDHLHSVGSLYTGGHSHGGPESANDRFHNNADSVVNLARPWGIASVGNIGVGGTTGAADRGLAVNSAGADRALATATNSTTWTLDPGSGAAVVDLRPRFIGLLKLMKVRRS
jgi:hypothetical protein